uniref:Mediator of RNA polymerase II transcription subunit 7 n=1 Tax=Macrostomum lignano TaxID=282301 RepID=A0A1I8FCF0_9PLAT
MATQPGENDADFGWTVPHGWPGAVNSRGAAKFESAEQFEAYMDRLETYLKLLAGRVETILANRTRSFGWGSSEVAQQQAEDVLLALGHAIWVLQLHLRALKLCQTVQSAELAGLTVGKDGHGCQQRQLLADKSVARQAAANLGQIVENMPKSQSLKPGGAYAG